MDGSVQPFGANGRTEDENEEKDQKDENCGVSLRSGPSRGVVRGRSGASSVIVSAPASPARMAAIVDALRRANVAQPPLTGHGSPSVRTMK